MDNHVTPDVKAPPPSVIITPELYAALTQSINNLSDSTKSLESKVDDLSRIYHTDIRRHESRLSKVETKLHVAGAIAGAALAAALASIAEILIR